jgi:hypothetical protein
MKKLTYFIEINRYNFPEWPMPTISFLFVFLSINLLYVSSAQQTFRDSIAFESNQTGTLNNYSPMSQLNYAVQEHYILDGSLPISVFDAPELSGMDTLNEFVPLSEFTYAGLQRYTLDGSLPRTVTEIKPTNLAILGGLYLGTFIGLHIYQHNAWWKDQRRGFHFEEDWVSALQADKSGHAYGGYMASYLMSEGLMASGFDWNDATLWGAVFGCVYQTYVETNDGFAKEWGFSPSDWYFDVLGPLFFLAQHHVEALQNITPKWQYVPTTWYGQPQIVRPSTVFDDYNSSSFYWSLNVYNILPEQLKQYWLPWLNIAVGYGANAVDAVSDPNEPPDQLSQRRYIVCLDYDLVKLLPDGGPFWNWFRQSLDLIKFPAPSFEFSNGITRFRLFYPFHLHLGSLKF